jgi:capsid protein
MTYGAEFDPSQYLADLRAEWREVSADRFRADYDGMTSSEHVRDRTGLPLGGGSGDFHARHESGFIRMLESIRDMIRNDAVIAPTIERSAMNVVQNGPTLSPTTGDKGLDLELWNRWEAWSNNPAECDEAGELNYRERLTLIASTVYGDGDMVDLCLDNGRLYANEAHQIRNPKSTRYAKRTVLGVELSPTRRRVAYHLRRDEINPFKTSASSKSKRWPTYDPVSGHRIVLHPMVPRRFTLTRGISALVPVQYVASMFEDLNFAKLVQAQIVSCFALWKSRDVNAPTGTLPTQSAPYGAVSNEPLNSDGSSRLIDEIKPGMQPELGPGERLEGWSPNVPNAEYFEHARLLLTLIGINLGQPLVMVLMDASESNFSGWRAAVEEARRGFRRFQRMLISSHCEHVYRWKVAQWAATDPAIAVAEKRLGSRLYAHRWGLPAWPYIDPVNDAASGLLRMRNGLTSPRRYHAEINQEFETIAEETIADNTFAIRSAMLAAARLNEELKPESPIHWREVLSLPTPDGVAVNIASAAGGDVTANAPPKGNGNAN